MPDSLTLQWAALDQLLSMLGPVSIAVLAAAVLAWGAVRALRGGQLRRSQSVRLTCPSLGHAVDCTIVQDIRTGQWKQVQGCSAFEPPDAVTCGRECTATMNLGLLSPRPGVRAGA